MSDPQNPGIQRYVLGLNEGNGFSVRTSPFDFPYPVLVPTSVPARLEGEKQFVTWPDHVREVEERGASDKARIAELDRENTEWREQCEDRDKRIEELEGLLSDQQCDWNAALASATVTCEPGETAGVSHPLEPSCSVCGDQPCPACGNDGVTELTESSVTSAQGEASAVRSGRNEAEPTRWWYRGQWWVKDGTRLPKTDDVVLWTQYHDSAPDIHEAGHDYESMEWPVLRPARTFECSDGVTRVESGEIRESRHNEWALGPATGEPIKYRAGSGFDAVILVPVEDTEGTES